MLIKRRGSITGCQASQSINPTALLLRLSDTPKKPPHIALLSCLKSPIGDLRNLSECLAEAHLQSRKAPQQLAALPASPPPEAHTEALPFGLCSTPTGSAAGRIRAASSPTALSSVQDAGCRFRRFTLFLTNTEHRITRNISNRFFNMGGKGKGPQTSLTHSGPCGIP